jgi:hypothetical protein
MAAIAAVAAGAAAAADRAQRCLKLAMYSLDARELPPTVTD